MIDLQNVAGHSHNSQTVITSGGEMTVWNKRISASRAGMEKLVNAGKTGVTAIKMGQHLLLVTSITAFVAFSGCDHNSSVSGCKCRSQNVSSF
jgi:hypothetical protein